MRFMKLTHNYETQQTHNKQSTWCFRPKGWRASSRSFGNCIGGARTRRTRLSCI